MISTDKLHNIFSVICEKNQFPYIRYIVITKHPHDEISFSIDNIYYGEFANQNHYNYCNHSNFYFNSINTEDNKVVNWFVPVQISAAACTSNVKSFDYSPCQYGRTSSYDNSIVCKSQLASEVLDAFRRNKDNAVIDNIYFQDIDDVTDEILEEILEVVIPSASNRVVEIMLLYLQNVTKVPRAIQQFTSLRTFGINFIEGLEILPSGSLTFSSNNLTELAFFGNPNLEVIEEGAFQGRLYFAIQFDSNDIMILLQVISMTPTSFSWGIILTNSMKQFSNLFSPIQQPQ